MPLNNLIDSQQRRYTYLRLSITDACNFRCNYCLPDGYSPTSDCSPLSLEEIKKIASTFAQLGTQKIRITGGEPLLRKDLADIIEVCKSTTGIRTVALTTNGYNLNKHLDTLEAAGLDALNISMDSLRPDTFNMITGHDKLLKIIDAIDKACEKRFSHVKINTVLMKEYNFGELETFLNFIKQRPITLRLIEVMQTGDNQQFYQAQHVSGEIIKARLLDEGWTALLRDANAGPAEEFFHPDYQGKIGLIMPYSKDFCRNCNRVRVASNGEFHHCLFGQSTARLRPLLNGYNDSSLIEHIQRAVLAKHDGHQLHQGDYGVTRHLAMIGG